MSHTRAPGPAGTLALDNGGHDGVPVVLAHSLAGTSAHWSRQLQHLRSSRRAVAFDFRAHGASEPARDRDYSISGLAGDLSAVVDSSGIGRFVLVGHSLGGGVALTYAGAHADRVAGLLLPDPMPRSRNACWLTSGLHRGKRSSSCLARSCNLILALH